MEPNYPGVKIVALILITLMGSCSNTSDEVHLKNNVYLFRSDDLTQSGFDVVTKINDHEYRPLTNGNVLEVYCDSANVFVKAIRNGNNNIFYHIFIKRNKFEIPDVQDITEPNFIKQTTKCTVCDKIKIELDPVSKVWVVKNVSK